MRFNRTFTFSARLIEIDRVRAVAMVFGVLQLTTCGQEPRCALEDTWLAGLQTYDYLQAVSFEDGGEGNMVWGDHQVVRLETDFRYRRLEGDQLELFDWSEHPYPTRRVRFEVTPGDYRIVQRTPAGDREVRYRCRARFEPGAFPSKVVPNLDYYARPVR